MRNFIYKNPELVIEKEQTVLDFKLSLILGLLSLTISSFLSDLSVCSTSFDTVSLLDRHAITFGTVVFKPTTTIKKSKSI